MEENNNNEPKSWWLTIIAIVIIISMVFAEINVMDELISLMWFKM